MRFASLLLLLVLALPARAQTSVVDNFTDGDFTANPAWSGEPAKWTVATRSGNNALALNGPAAADTAYLVTPSNVSYGTWHIRYLFDFNQTTSNGARIYLVSNSANLRGPLQGYYLQIGTNNNDEVRLVRQDGDTRTAIGTAVAASAVGNTGVITLDVTRDGSGNWTVNVSSVTDTNPSTTGTITATDATFTASSYFGVWSKHSTTANTAQAFDDVNVSGTTGPPDTTPPSVTASSYDQTANTFSVTFSEPVQTSSLTALTLAYSGTTSYTIEGTGVSGATATGALLRFASVPPAGAYTVIAQGVLDVAGNAMTTTTLQMNVSFNGAVAVANDLIVNEIMFAPPTGGSEYVEFYNRSSKTFNLSDFRFNDNTGTPRVITTQPVAVTPGAYIVIVQNLTTFQSAYPGVTAIQASSWPTLNNDVDAAVLKYAASGGATTVIDSMAYAVPPAVSGRSYERKDPTGASVASNFAASTATNLGTPGAQNSVYFIDTAAPVAQNAEETAAQTVVVTYDEPINPSTATASRFSVNGVSPTSATVSSDGLRVTLVFAAALGGNTLSIGAGVQDIKGNAAAATTLPVGRAALAGDLVVNEIMANPLAVSTDNLPDQPEYIELFNRSNKPLSLTGLIVVGQPNELGVADTLRLTADGKTVPAGGYVVIYDADATDGANPATDSRLAKAFPAINFASANIVLLGPSTVTSGGLTNSGERLRVVVRGVTTDDVTYSSAWYAPARSRAGISLERIDPAGPSNAATNWTSSLASAGGTPGLANSVTALTGVGAAAAGDVVVNEIMYDPRASSTDNLPDQPEYVEFYNRSSNAFDLNGWYLTNTPDENGVADTVRIAYAPTRLAAGSFAVVYRSSGVFSSSTNPDSLFRLAFPSTPTDAVLLRVTGLSLPNDGGLVALHAVANVTVDAVTYDPKWNNGGVRDATGVSLERRDPAVASNEPTNWGSSPDPEGGTPGRANALTLTPNDPNLPASAGVTAEPSPFSPDGDGMDDVTLLRYRLNANNTGGTIRVRIFNLNGRLVRTLTAAQIAGPVGQIAWDGFDDEGRGLALGPYIVLLDSVDPNGGTTESYRKVVTLARQLN